MNPLQVRPLSLSHDAPSTRKISKPGAGRTICGFLAGALLFSGTLPGAYGASRGVNMSGAEFGSLPGSLGTAYTYNSAASFQYFGNKGLTLIRIPILWERIQPTLNGPLDTTNLNALTQDIAWAKSYGCKVIIDIHDYGRYAINEGGTYNSYVIDNSYGGVVKVSAANLANLWTQLSTQFKNEPAVYAYGLMNEPHDMGTANWSTISQTVLTAIRNNGDNKLIMVPGNGWAGAANWSGNNGPTSWISDPANNFKYEAHLYFDHDSSGTYNWTYDQELANNPNIATVGQTRLANFTNWCATNGVSGFLGEYGAPNTDSRWFTVLDNFLSALDAVNFDATIWSAGEWWGSYPLSVQPSNNYTVDAAQMPTLLRHLGSVSGGLNGQYFDNQNFTGTEVARIDPTVNFNWGSGSPDPAIAPNTFSARWTGFVQPLYSQTYTFYTDTDDGVRLWVNGQQVINNWTDHGSTEDSGTITLTAGQFYPIRMEYYQNGGGTLAQLLWSSASQAKQIIPTSQLVPTLGGLVGSYFGNMSLSGTPVVRIDPTVNFIWNGVSPISGIGTTGYSVRWSGSVLPDTTDTYTFTTTSDDGVRLWVNGQQIINNWTDHGTTQNSGSIALIGGQSCDVQMEFYQNGGGATAELSWSNSTLAQEIVPIPSLKPYPTWTSADVGGPGIAGGSTFNPANGAYTVQGSGGDIWGSFDAFQFFSQPLTGNGQIVARVTSVGNTDGWAKAGVMIRETLASNSVHAIMAVTPGNGLAMQYRTSTGGGSNSISGGSATAPYWVKLVRSGATISGYVSPDGATWTLVSSQTITMASQVNVGLSVTAHNNGALCTATFDNVQMTALP